MLIILINLPTTFRTNYINKLHHSLNKRDNTLAFVDGCSFYNSYSEKFGKFPR